jgi:hypothetical protein
MTASQIRFGEWDIQLPIREGVSTPGIEVVTWYVMMGIG